MTDFDPAPRRSQANDGGQRPAVPSRPHAPTTLSNSAMAAVVQRDAGPSGGTHTVARGETLWKIAAARLGSGRRWREIVALNKGKYPRIGSGRANLVRAGWVLDLPGAGAAPALDPNSAVFQPRPGREAPVSHFGQSQSDEEADPYADWFTDELTADDLISDRDIRDHHDEDTLERH